METCPNCGNKENSIDANFCKNCGKRIRRKCKCWIKKKDNYDCGCSSCPGYGLFRIEKSATKMNDILKNRIINFQNDIQDRVDKECEAIKKDANPRKEIEEYVRNIRWSDPELASYIKKRMLITLNLNN